LLWNSFSSPWQLECCRVNNVPLRKRVPDTHVANLRMTWMMRITISEQNADIGNFTYISKMQPVRMEYIL
jgi:hypothetical protein